MYIDQRNRFRVLALSFEFFPFTGIFLITMYSCSPSFADKEKQIEGNLGELPLPLEKLKLGMHLAANGDKLVYIMYARWRNNRMRVANGECL